MQINRLFETVYILLNRKNVTAKELADRFEVSQRTIYRDIETLCQAGIPIYTNKGRGGGIGLLEGFILDKSVLSQEEQGEILSALQGIEAMKGSEMAGVLSKLSSLFGTTTTNWIEVDLSDWGYSNREKFSSIKQAILEKKVVCFDYFGVYGEKSQREVEPIQLWFKDKTWYLRAYCRTKQEMRTFKLTRLKELVVTDETFKRVPVLKEIVQYNNYHCTIWLVLKLEIDFSQAYRVYDEFDEEDIQLNEQGDFIVTIQYPEEDWIYGWILSYGIYAKVLEPPFVRKIMKSKLTKILEMYP